MDSLESILFGILAGPAGRQDVVGRDEVNNYTIDTCYTIDQGWETAVWKGDNSKMIIVARYPDRKAAEMGHKEWVETCTFNRPIGAFSVQTDEWTMF